MNNVRDCCDGCGNEDIIECESGLCESCYEKESEVTKEEFMKYEEVRKSGKCFMLDLAMVEKMTELSRDKLLKICGYYKELNRKYGGLE